VRWLLPLGSDLFSEALALGIPALVGVASYAVLVWLMRMEEIELIALKVTQRLRRSRGRADLRNNS
jgi:hypothetical protein